jgi:hypothetical protein
MTAYVINIPERGDRWEAIQTRIGNHFDLVRFDAEKAEPGWLGLNRTMKRLFELATTDTMVFEDDATWTGSDRFEAITADLPPDFDMLLFGANIQHHRLERVSAGIVRTYGAWTTHAVLYSHAFCKRMATEFDPESLVIDEYFRTRIHPEGSSYVTDPFYSVQLPCHSDINNQYADYSASFANSLHQVRRAK